MSSIPSIDILGMKVNVVQIPNVINLMAKWIDKKTTGNYIVISNANDVISSRKDVNTREAVNNSSLSVPDGISLEE